MRNVIALFLMTLSFNSMACPQDLTLEKKLEMFAKMDYEISDIETGINVMFLDNEQLKVSLMDQSKSPKEIANLKKAQGAILKDKAILEKKRDAVYQAKNELLACPEA